MSLEVGGGEFLSLLGPSGCGKTTLLRIIAGLERLDEGAVFIGGEDVSRLPAHRRPLNMVFQRYALFPHKTVGDNIGFSLMLNRVGRRDIRRRVDEMLELVRLPGFGKRRIDELSGGQAQRVALARALISHPPVLLLDEPLAALDLKLRQSMHVELREIQRRVNSTFIYVTHDQQEAFALSDRVILMNEGRIVQSGRPAEVYARPRTLFAATFLGEANIFAGRSAVGRGGVSIETPVATFLLGRRAESRSDGSEVRLCLRPESIVLEPEAGDPPDVEPNTASGVLIDSVFFGSVVRYRVGAADAEILVEVPRVRARVDLRRGDGVRLAWHPDDVVVLTE